MSADARGLEFEFVQPGEAVVNTRRVPACSGATYRSGCLPSAARPSAARPALRFTRRLRTRRALPLLIGLLSALVFIVATDGGSLIRRPVPVIPHVDHFFERVGLGLSEIAFTGQQNVSDREIYARLALAGTRSIWMIDTDAARRRIEALPWVRSAALKRVFPDRLIVQITEWPPFVLWRDGTRTVAVGETGRVLGPVDPARFESLPVVYGANAAAAAPAVVRAVARLPALAPRVALYERVAERRWTLHLKSGQRIHLPSEGQSRALLMLVDGPAGSRLIDLDFQSVDLRIPDRPAIVLREARR